jgi:hypothetical protein
MIEASRVLSAVIRGDIVGAGRTSTGAVEALHLMSLEVGGSLIGGAGERSGSITGRIAETIQIAGSVLGGSGLYSGSIYYVENIETLLLLGSLRGGDAAQSGLLQAAQFGTVTIHGDIENSSVQEDVPGHPVISGAISGRSAEQIHIRGWIVAAELSPGGPDQTAYAVSFTDRVNKLLIDGAVMGNAANRLGLAAGFGINDIDGGFGAIKIGGSVAFAEISAGFQRIASPLTSQIGNAEAEIGKLVVAGSWTASSVSSGTQPGTDGLFGTEDDGFVLVNGEETPGLAAISKVVIRGELDGTSGTGDHFGFVAGRIGTVSLNGLIVPLTTGQTDVVALPASTDDVTLRELRDQ